MSWPTLTTSRLVLRPWRPSDLEAYAAMNTDPRVVEFLPKALNREESDALAGRIQQNFVDHGFGLWAVELPGVAEFIGFTGLAQRALTRRFARIPVIR